MLKEELRLNFTSLRSGLSREEVYSSNSAIVAGLGSLPIWELEFFHIFLPIEDKNEVDTWPIIRLLFEKGKRVAVPKVVSSNTLTHFELKQDTQLQTNRWGIPEPVSGRAISEDILDVVFIPLLAFDNKGNRVGYGQGYYDRFLSLCRLDSIKIGLSFFEAIDEISDVSQTDVALNYCVTPLKVYSF